MSYKNLMVAVSAAALLSTSPAFANDADLESLRAEIKAMQQAYEKQITVLERKLETLEAKQAQTESKVEKVSKASGSSAVNSDGLTARQSATPATGFRSLNDSSFNPSIGVILQTRFNSFSEGESELTGFGVGHEGERQDEGFVLDETELNFAANVDNLFRGSATLAVVEEEGETEIEIEEAYVETLGLANGLNVKAGRFFQTFGYLNEQHSHADDFADRPLSNRVFLDEQFNDTGVELGWILPTDFYAEIGGSVLQGEDYPAGGNEDTSIGAYTLYGRVGGDIGANQAWRAGVYHLGARDVSRTTNEDQLTFAGDSDLYAVDFRYIWAPTGNPVNEELILQAEAFWREEDGTYSDTSIAATDVTFDDSQFGWYAQGVYKFHPNWRVGARFSQLYAANAPTGLSAGILDDNGHDPYNASMMLDWTNSEFARVRLQYNYEELSESVEDNQIMLQYIMSIGAHGAHPF